MDTSLTSRATKDATSKVKRAKRLAKALADLMKDIHGGEWGFDISHDVQAEFILVRPTLEAESPVQPKPEIA